MYNILQPTGENPSVVKTLFYYNCINKSCADNKKWKIREMAQSIYQPFIAREL
jgi:hypothetical protein